jgi:RimJ/RimL family protein N-acetyltransferase
MPTELQTPRLLGRLPREGDAAAMLALYGRPEVAGPLYPDGRAPNELEVQGMIVADLAHWRAHRFGRLYWQEHDSREVVARCGAKLAIVGGRAEVDLHWAVRADRHRHGLAREAAEAVVRACFRSLGAESVTAVAHVDNAASQGLARALGFVDDGDVEHLGLPHRLFRRMRAG